MFELLEKFRNWCRQKIYLHDGERVVLFKQGEIWWCAFGINIGEEVYGKGATFTRPVLILKKFSSNLFLGIPLTSRERSGTWFVKIKMGTKQNWVLLHQARALDRRRLVDRIGTVDDKQMRIIRDQYFALLAS